MEQAHVARSRDELRAILGAPQPPEALIPDLVASVAAPETLRGRPGLDLALAESTDALADIANMPTLTYSLFRSVQRQIDRSLWEVPFFEKRSKLAAAALQVLLGNDRYRNDLYDYIWSICEETIWIVPQRRDLEVDLRTAATGLSLAEIAVGLAPHLEPRLGERIREEIDRRVFRRYLAHKESWWKGHNNWNGVCNGAIGCMFLLLEPDPERLAQGLADVLEGLQVFVDTAFDVDGGSGEGVGYWQYGLSNYIVFSEMLRLRTEGEIDLLASNRLRDIAAFPPKVMLSPGRYFSYSDSNEESALHPGLVQRLAERTGVAELCDVLAEPARLTCLAQRFHQMWRAIAWWDGARPQGVQVEDAYLPESKIVRLTGRTPAGAPVVLATKAQHNGVPHNHDDVGGFVLHVDGETFICDPERGLYDQYVLYGTDKVVFSNSYGHSVPVIANRLQAEGPQYGGEILEQSAEGGEKRVRMRIDKAYRGIGGLTKAERLLCLTGSGDVVLEDEVSYSTVSLPVEEAIVTWLETKVDGSTARIQGTRHDLVLTIEAPAGATFALEVLEEESKANRKPVPLKRLSFRGTPADQDLTLRVRARAIPKGR
jgi:hypothetical protein